MGHPPRMGKFSTEHQPPRTSSQPASHAAKEQQQIEDEIEAREQELDERAMGGQQAQAPVEMTPEERATAEREKAELLADLKSTRPAKPGPERGAPESLSSRPISDIGGRAPERQVEDPEPAAAPEVVKAPVLTAEEQQAALTELELLEAEVAALEAERLAAEKASREGLARIKADTDTKLALIRTKRAEAEAKAKEARDAAARASLADQARVAEREAEANRQRRLASAEEQRKALRSVRPLLDDKRTFGEILDTAKRTVKAIAAINREIGPGLRTLAALPAWEGTPSTWPVSLRKRMGNEVIMPARELVKMISSYSREDDGPAVNIARAERLLQTWKPGDHLATLSGELGHCNDDSLRYIREQATLISTRYEEIQAEGKAYVSSGEVPTVVVLLNENIRQGMKHEILTKGLHVNQQTAAEGTIYVDELPQDRDKITGR